MYLRLKNFLKKLKLYKSNIRKMKNKTFNKKIQKNKHRKMKKF